MITKCKVCGNNFDTHGTTAKHCSDDCKKVSRLKASKRYHDKNPNYQRVWVSKNLEHVRCRDKNYYLNHKKERELYRKTHREEKNRKVRDKNYQLRQEIINLLGSHCSNPYNIDHSSFENHPEYFNVLQIDHINGGGKKEIKGKYKNDSYKYYKKVLNSVKYGEKEYQLLCPTCNWIKRKVNKE